MASRLMLLDSASLYYRAFYGVPDRFTAVDGTPTNAVRGFIDMVAQLIERFAPDQLVACWDDDWRPQFRVDLVPTYKAHRVADESDRGIQSSPDTSGEDGVEEMPDSLSLQEPMIAEVLKAVGIPIIGASGFEADDVIAQLARNHIGGVDIVTGDRDLFQLVDDSRGVRVLYTARGLAKLGIVDDTWVEAKYGVTAGHYADFALLRGDASDGLPGVSGVGEKTAARLVNEFGSIDGILAAARDDGSDITKRVRASLLTSADYLKRADPVVRLNHHVGLPAGPYPVPREPHDEKKTAQLADEYRMQRQFARLQQAVSR